MRVRFNRIEAFLAWCANKVKDTVTPMSKGTLSKIYVNEEKLAYQPYYFSIYAPDDMLTDHIKNSTHSFGVQTKLMCLLSLPVDQDYLEVLTQFATIKLDKFRRIIVYKHGETVIKCEHRKARTDKYKSFRETSGHQERDNVEEKNNHGSGTSTTSQTREPKKAQPAVTSEPDDVAPSKKVVINRKQLASSTSEQSQLLNNFASSQSDHHHSPHYEPHGARYQNNVSSSSRYLSQEVKEEQQESSYHSSWVNETLQSCVKIGTSATAPNMFNQRFSENSDSTSSNSHAPRYQSIASIGEPILVEVLQKLEYYFLYKCKPELMPLCLRIKEVKENEATFTRKIVSPSTINSFFEVALRLMMAKKIQEPIKTEQGEV